MLVGYPPFRGQSDVEILKKVKVGQYVLDPVDWEQVSSGAKDLISKMLEKDPVKRISAEAALQHEWIQKN
jgi:serine/threonine protein kinase